MASCTSIHGSPIGAFKHDLRERDTYKNEDIDKGRSYLNYVLSGHGETTKECMKYLENLLDGVYHREGETVITAEWSIQAPTDLMPEKEEAFFRSTYEFLNQYHFDGDGTRCLLATVHKDEAGEPHLHYVFTFPEIENNKYTDLREKFVAGMEQAIDKYDLRLSRDEVEECFAVIQRYEKRTDTHRERDGIREIGEVLGLKHDDARWVFTRVRRLESERYEMKLMPKDQFLNREFYEGFHPAYQAWITEHGFDCTVYKGGGGINLSVDQLKAITRETGIKLEKGLSVETLSNYIKSDIELQGVRDELRDVSAKYTAAVKHNEQLEHENSVLNDRVSKFEKQNERSLDAWGRSREVDAWGHRKEDIKWDR